MTNEPIHVVGGGLVGTLASIFLAKRGYEVALYERRPDMRSNRISAGRSINLAVTARGLNALEAIGLREAVLALAIPMRGRMLHDVAGKTTFVPYGQKPHEVIYSVSRGDLNKLLLTEAERYPNLSISFEQRCTHYDAATRTLTFHDEQKNSEYNVAAPIVLGTDGASSVLRDVLAQSNPECSLSQEKLDYGYKELEIPATASGAFQMEKEALHIWPRQKYMMIALPNLNGSFTVTLFYPHKGPESFEHLTSEAQVRRFFEREFPDALALMPDLDLFFSNPVGSMITVRLAPWRLGDQLMLIGDASHAIVPFFGQGMNSGFEDCSALGALLDAHTGDWAALFLKLETARKPNADAIADLALENFIEMRDTVADPKFQLKKQIGFALEQRYPGRFIPRYAMVVFHPEIPYAEARRLGILQDKMLDTLAANCADANEIDWATADRLMATFA